MSEEENQSEEENNEQNNEEQNEDLDEEKNNESNDEDNNNEINQENEEQKEQEQEQDNLGENDNNEEVKEIENIINENDNNEENNNNINNNNEIEEEIKIANDNNENENVITQENEQQIENEDEIDNKENNININPANLLSFGKNGIFGENININLSDYNYISKKNTYQILNEINNDMDLLEKNLKPIFNNCQIKKHIYNSYYTGNEEYDDREIKELIKKANRLVNNNSFNYYGPKTDYNRNNHYKRNNLSEIYPNNRIENGGNYSNYSEINENSSYDDNDNGYMRNISPEKNINKHRIKNIKNIHEYTNNNNYNPKPIIYRQNETFPIKNSYMNEIIGQPQTYNRKEYYPKNLVFSSDKIPFKKIKYGGNINQSLDILFKEPK